MDKPKRIELTPEQLARIQRAKDRYTRRKPDSDLYWTGIAEFGLYFGWEAVQAVLGDEISADVMNALLSGARQQRALDELAAAQATFIGVGAAMSKDTASTFNKMTADIRARAGI